MFTLGLAALATRRYLGLPALGTRRYPGQPAPGTKMYPRYTGLADFRVAIIINYNKNNNKIK